MVLFAWLASQLASQLASSLVSNFQTSGCEGSAPGTNGCSSGRLLLSVTGQSPALSLNSVPQCEQVVEEDRMVSLRKQPARVIFNSSNVGTHSHNHFKRLNDI